ncbi:hypothetical protein GQ44DRAFT_719470 [Phaeosphaeriaceae sp. PMI808]|nr:hypothetical protein GQ44DRAFT_719470 [Phaeosphaeriaceae sp. PMI808]
MVATSLVSSSDQLRRTSRLRMNRAPPRKENACPYLALGLELMVVGCWPVAAGRLDRVWRQQDRVNKDVYKFDEAGFIMGKIITRLVGTGSERRGQPKTIQFLTRSINSRRGLG